MSKNIRNIALIGHSDEGKTTLAEAMLFNAGAIDRFGKVDDGTATMDYDPEEINRKMSISLSVAHAMYQGVKFNIIDVPGFFDFEGEMISALKVADSAIIVTSAGGDLSVGTEKAIDYCIETGKPCMIFVNQIDKENANYAGTVGAIKERYGNKVATVLVPIVENTKMTGYISGLSGKTYKFTPDGRQEVDMPADLADEYAVVKQQLEEIAAETSDNLLEKFFAGEELTREEITNGVKFAIGEGNTIPLLAGSALTNKGIINLMIYIINCMPSPSDAPSVKGEAKGETVKIYCDDSEPFVAQVFKTVADPFVGKLSLFKVLRGTLNAGDQIYNVTSEKVEKAASLYVMKGKKQEPVQKLVAGDVGALAKLLYTGTGDTLCDPYNIVKCAPIEFPKPNISLAVSAVKQGEDEKVIAGLNRLLEEDSTFKVEKNVETNQMLVSGLGELQLDVICKRLKQKFNVEAKLDDPKIPYRETIKKKVEAQGKHKKQSGGHGQYGDCWVRFEPYPDGDFAFAEEVVGGSVPKQYIPAVEKGLRECVTKGVLAGYPMVNIKATLYDGSYHDVDSSEMAFKIAASIAYNTACSQANPVLLEPIMLARITIPKAYMGDVLGDLSKRRGRILGMDSLGAKDVISAEVPHSEMFKYSTDLRSMTQGRGSFDMEFVRYEEMPVQDAQKVIENAKKAN